MIVVDETLNKKWNWWPLFPLYPYGKKKTILKEVIPSNMVLGTNTGTLLCCGSNKNDGNKG